MLFNVPDDRRAKNQRCKGGLLNSTSILLIFALIASGCAGIPTSGPSASIVNESASRPGNESIQIVAVTAPVARELLAQRSLNLFSDGLIAPKVETRSVAPGDTLEVTVWEAPPATLFGGSASETRAGAPLATSRATNFPDQIVNTEGRITVPFAGSIQAAGRTNAQIEQEIVTRLKGKANQPQVLVRLLRNTSATVTIVGEVAQSTRMPLTPGNERLLDALAAAGGVRNPVNKVTLQITRGNTVMALPLETIIRDPKQNVPLQAGDVITAYFQPLSFTALGATGKNEEVNFEAQGITLAQALGRIGGLQDTRSDASGVFIFRYENLNALAWPRQPAGTTAEGKVPVIYTIDLKDPASFFVMQSFNVQNKDLLYVANAPLAEFQKFASVVYSIAFPVINTISVTR